ncbi:uncharacterized protein MONBRDRAFT_24034 [Monosiga brevicollis MX1]|uniref:C-CAP/cofactor C-like domain-containing protein n=1 Tax=Monosiga brevicollis TaxID=81824 RepID=A9UUI2_MONBE|nr:uncharacterized protein MONBRDRAFT_24034 [Monosiga brevicollis MX1]EDQ91101.1 predicted protein [Monosiga brevicollis MX1]|eukprot:XP_001744398.1 hypothetical protein [Monosiga brevicollis MX1]
MTTKACCAAGPPVSFEHKELGQEKDIDGIRCYVSGDPSASKAGVMVIYDIFGLDHPQVRCLSDKLAAAGYYAVVPDIFRKEPWTLEKFPPSTPELKEAFGQFLERAGAQGPKDAETILSHFKSVGLTGKAGVIGFCWGGKLAVTLAAHEQVGAVVGAHAAFLDQATVDKAQAPIRFYPANGDCDCEPFVESLKARGFDLSETKRYDDQIHGFCAARGEWDRPEAYAASMFVFKNFLTDIKKFDFFSLAAPIGGHLTVTMGNLFARRRAPAETPKVYSWDKREACNPEDLKFVNRTGETLFKGSGDIGLGQQFTIDNCHDCFIFLMDVSSTVTIDDCTNCTFFVAPIQGRTRDCKQLQASLFCQTLPIIESSSDVRFTCFRGSYFALSGQMTTAQLNPYCNYWAKIHDFTPNRDDPNYAIELVEPQWLGEMWDKCAAAASSVQIDRDAGLTTVPITQGPGKSATELSTLLVLFPPASKGAKKIVRGLAAYPSIHLQQTRAHTMSPDDLDRLMPGVDAQHKAMLSQGEVVTLELAGEGVEAIAQALVQDAGSPPFCLSPVGNTQIINAIHSHMDTAMKI